MIITKKEQEVLYSILLNQEELDIIADSISATNMDLSEVPEEEQEAKKREQLLRILEPWAKVVCMYTNKP